MTNDEIIEAMARAHCESEAYEKGFLRDGAWSDGLTNNDRQTRVKHMRAALRAAMEHHADWCATNEGTHERCCDCHVAPLGALVGEE